MKRRRPPFVGPLVEGLPRQLGAVVEHELGQRPALGENPLAHLDHACSEQRRVDLDRQRLSGEHIHDGEEPDPSAPGQGVAQEVDAHC
jgi:hypothetical protein